MQLEIKVFVYRDMLDVADHERMELVYTGVVTHDTQFFLRI